MKRAGVIGLGDMGSGLARNLIKAGHPTIGFDLSDTRMAAFAELGGTPASSVGEVGGQADVVFVMVMNGDQAKAVIFEDDCLIATLAPGGGSDPDGDDHGRRGARHRGGPRRQRHRLHRRAGHRRLRGCPGGAR